LVVSGKDIAAEERIAIPEKHQNFAFGPCLLRYLEMSASAKKAHNNRFQNYLR